MLAIDSEIHTNTNDKVAEELLLRAVQNNDLAAYKVFYQTHVGRVYALCYRLVGGDVSMAEDATQEVFIQVWKSIATFDQRSQLATWLHRVTANTCITYLRKQKSWFEKIFLSDSTALETMHDVPVNELDLGKLEHCLLRLPERARIVFVLHALEGYQHEEIAQMNNIAVGTSKAQFHRAKKLLNQWLGEEYV